MARVDDRRADDIATAGAVCVLPEIANWLPAERHEWLKEVLYDLVYSSIYAYVDLDSFRIPPPSRN